MFNLKLTPGDGGQDASLFAADLESIIIKSTGVLPRTGVFCLPDS